MPKQSEDLPPGTFRKGSGLARKVPRGSADGTTWEEERPVAETLAEAKEKRFDYYHPELVWIREGYKLERDRSTESILADDSQAVPVPTASGEAKESEES